MLKYNANLREKARPLRRNLTDSEKALWSQLRKKQLFGIQFYRQKPIGEPIVDFFSPGARLVVEVDGSQHIGDAQVQKDRIRDGYLASLGLKVLRCNSREVLKEGDAVVESIYQAMTEQLNAEIPPGPPLKKGERGGFIHYMENYNQHLKHNARKLRSNMTDAEQLLWQQLRRKQILGLPFYRQKPLLDYIVDFYCPKARLVVELDGGQHFECSAST